MIDHSDSGTGTKSQSRGKRVPTAILMLTPVRRLTSPLLRLNAVWIRVRLSPVQVDALGVIRRGPFARRLLRLPCRLLASPALRSVCSRVSPTDFLDVSGLVGLG